MSALLFLSCWQYLYPRIWTAHRFQAKQGKTGHDIEMPLKGVTQRQANTKYLIKKTRPARASCRIHTVGTLASSHFLPLISLSGIYSVRAAPLPHARQTGSVTRCGKKAPVFIWLAPRPGVIRLSNKGFSSFNAAAAHHEYVMIA
ncbi:hypothetical protein HDV63DRAFT_3872 [Trichoderma sp. SZMC 28014]